MTCPVVAAIEKLGGEFETLTDNLFIGGNIRLRYSTASFKAGKLNMRLASLKIANADLAKCLEIVKYTGPSSKIIKSIISKNKFIKKITYKLAKQISKFENSLLIYLEKTKQTDVSMVEFKRHKDLYQTLQSAIEYILKLSISGKKPEPVDNVAEFTIAMPEFTIVEPTNMEELDIYVDQMTQIYKYLEKLEHHEVECIEKIQCVINRLVDFKLLD